MLVKITNNQVEKFPYTIGDFRRSKPNVSFPKNISRSLLEENGIFEVVETTPENYNNQTHTYSYEIKFVNGAWSQVWTSERLPEEVASSNIRRQRNSLLSQSDFSQLPDSQVDKEDWATYRQLLRDIPAQEGFPWSVEWPTQP